MAKNPAFQFYASDWLGSTKRAMMTPAQRGAYIDLLCHQWGDETCSLPDDDELLAGLSGLGEAWGKGGYKMVRPCFPPHPTLEGRIANPRLLEIRAEREEWVEKSRLGGLKSAEKRWGSKGGYKMVTENCNQTVTKGVTKGQPKCNPPSPSPSPIKETTNVVSSPPKTVALPSGFRFPLSTSKLWDLPKRKLEEYETTYRDKFDLNFELRKARQWLADKPDRRPRSGRGMAGFLTRWLNRASDSAGRTMPGSTVAAVTSDKMVFNAETGEIVMPKGVSDE